MISLFHYLGADFSIIINIILGEGEFIINFEDYLFGKNILLSFGNQRF